MENLSTVAYAVSEALIRLPDAQAYNMPVFLKHNSYGLRRMDTCTYKGGNSVKTYL